MLRGEIYYIYGQGNLGVHDSKPARPAIILTSNKLIPRLDQVQVVYLTTHPRNDLPTHVTIRSCPIESTAVCETIAWVDKNRIGDFCGVLTQQELECIDRALLVSLGIDLAPDTHDEYEYDDDDDDEDDYTEEWDEDEDPEEDAAKYILELMRVRGERDAYKAMVDKLLGSGAEA